ncbi:hypothetical protein E2C01_039172 [Portunus trituberculatus]|uniref:Uncharacterized protein n=1 Tax=Portunus trituberculatus TaxID=210409 RepID=A0A5B7FK08_PORTR|nr:hypothetical protein [Portunus trituberculatus]
MKTRYGTEEVKGGGRVLEYRKGQYNTLVIYLVQHCVERRRAGWGGRRPWQKLVAALRVFKLCAGRPGGQASDEPS